MFVWTLALVALVLAGGKHGTYLKYCYITPRVRDTPRLCSGRDLDRPHSRQCRQSDQHRFLHRFRGRVQLRMQGQCRELVQL
jgi:hypothetical protein